MQIAHQIYHELETEFTRLDVKQEIVDRGYTLQYAQQVLEYLTLSGLAERIDRGLYAKTGAPK